jgi:hypothetical protein
VRDRRLTPIVKHDKRFKDAGAHDAVETEALSQSVIVEIVRNRLNELLPQPLADIQGVRKPSASACVGCRAVRARPTPNGHLSVPGPYGASAMGEEATVSVTGRTVAAPAPRSHRSVGSAV